MRVAAYLLAADPAWIEMSVASYYPLVSKIVVSYDVDGLGWTGTAIPIEECLDRLRSVDPENKIVLLRRPYSDPSKEPMSLETRQRQEALDLAGKDVDWVLQVDSDEVFFNPHAFAASLQAADKRGADALEYPARVFRQRAGPGLYLEECSRFWRVTASYPGPIAVRSGVRLRVARKGPASDRIYRVDFRTSSTDPAQPNAAVHDVIRQNDALMHFSWVRETAHLERKFESWAHARDRDWSGTLRRWQRAARFPRLTASTSLLHRDGPLSHLRTQHLPGVDGVGGQRTTADGARTILGCK